MYSPEQDRVSSYREFCQLLQDSEKCAWFDRLLNFYIETGRGQKPERVEEARGALTRLSLFLDKAVGGGASLEIRYQAEGIRSS